MPKPIVFLIGVLIGILITGGLIIKTGSSYEHRVRAMENKLQNAFVMEETSLQETYPTDIIISVDVLDEINKINRRLDKLEHQKWYRTE